MFWYSNRKHVRVYSDIFRDQERSSKKSGLKPQTLKSTDPRFNPSISTDFYVTWNLLLTLAKAPCPQLQYKGFNTIYLMGLWSESMAIMHRKCLNDHSLVVKMNVTSWNDTLPASRMTDSFLSLSLAFLCWNNFRYACFQEGKKVACSYYHSLKELPKIRIPSEFNTWGTFIHIPTIHTEKSQLRLFSTMP